MASSSYQKDLKWSEISSGSEQEDEDMIENQIMDDFKWKETKNKFLNCCCMDPKKPTDVVHILSGENATTLTPTNCQCHISNIERCINKVIVEEDTEETSWMRLMVADYFYRFRHELLSIATLSVLNLPLTQTDVPFNTYGIESNRTPDYIVIRDGVHHILEFTATANEEKAAQMKGLESAGFESKYSKEIRAMQEIGLKVVYTVIMFNMIDSDNSSAWEVIESLKDKFELQETNYLILKNLSRELSRLTKITKPMFGLASSLLFSPTFVISKNHINLDFCYTNEPFVNDYIYKDYNVSMPVYQKINTMWHRLLSLKERQTDPDYKVIPILEMAESKIKFINDIRGVTTEEFNNIILNNDKQKFFELLRLRIGNKTSKATESETGVRYTKKVQKRYVEKILDLLPVSLDHDCVLIDLQVDADMVDKYVQLIFNQKSHNYNPIFFDPDYENKLLKSMDAFDSKSTEDYDLNTFHLSEDLPITLASYDADKVDIDGLMVKLNEEFDEANKEEVSIPVRNRKMKSSFLLPMASVSQKDRCSLGNKNISFLNVLEGKDIGEYTKSVLRRVGQEEYSFYDSSPPPSLKLNETYNSRYKISNSITKIVKNAMKSSEGVDRLRFNKKVLNDVDTKEFESLVNEVSKLNKFIRQVEKDEGIKRNIGMVKLNTKPKSMLHSAFRSEMSHFKDRRVQSSYEGIGLSNNKEAMHVKLTEEFDNIMDSMVMNCGENDDFLIDLNTYEEVKLLKDLKQHTLDNYKCIINQAKNSMLGHSAAFVSRYAHSLTFYSQLPFNSSYVRVDNLGYENVLLIVRGGSKIFKTKSSKLHRLIFPVNNNVLGQYIDHSFGDCSFKHFTYNECDYIVTPWILLNENILLDAISFYPRVMSFCVLNMDYEKNFRSQLHRVFLNVILAFHNRRHTESMLANLRYILLSTMGDYSAFPEIFKEFIGFNYDKVQAFLRLQLIKNYPQYYNTMRKIQKMKTFNPLEIERLDLTNIFTMYPMYNTDDIALMIYSTFLMTKAPYHKSVERASNLKGIISIHKLFDEQVGLDLNPEEQLKKISVVNNGKDYIKYSSELMKSDFALDPYYCTNVGIFADSYFEQNVGRDNILIEWVKTLNKNWDSMATTTGLRGMRPDNFFGQKGFFVIYDHILNNENYKEKLKFILDSEVPEDTKRKTLRDLNQTYGNKISDSPECLIYHAVDKRQWRGGREIYVMDLETKRMQQPIEKFMSFLCRKTDTELISIPSDKRSQVIHHALFEKDIPDRDFHTWFLTLDCSKWAPKSMFIKFALMIIPMQSIPGTFKTHFMNYLSLLYSKRLYFNKPEVQVLLNNPKHKNDLNSFLISDDKVNGFYMIQPYSWVMGIFNYTSSLMHAFNQKYCSYLLRESTLSNFSEDCSLFMFAHSDDSGGRIAVTSQPALVRALYYYEINLKACNHILSRKKCVISKIYFEILSIIYMFSELLALLPKFLGGIRFLPTDKGPSHDMLQTYSKSIEIMVAGADFNKAYLYQKFYSAEIWRFYYNTRPSVNDYLRPPQHLGMPDAHPLMILLNGSDSDLIRLISSGNMKHLILTHRIFKYLDTFESDEGLIKSLKFIVKIRGVKKGFHDSVEEYSELLKSWSLSNVNYKNTGMDSLCFLKKLNDPGFTGALVNETETRRMSRAYFFRAGDAINTKIGIKNLQTVFQMVSEVQLLFENSKETIFSKFFGESAVNDFMEETRLESELNRPIITYFTDIYANSLKLCDYFNRMDFSSEKLKRASRTLKPTHIQIVKFGKGFNTDFDPTQLISSIYEPELSWALPNPSNLSSAKKDFESLLSHLDLSKDSIDASTALKLVRSHQNKSVKEIYMYSCIPGYIRMIKNFAGIITFLSTNSFQNFEIQGMSLKLRENLTTPPIGLMDIDEEAYYIVTLLDVLCTLGNTVDLQKVELNPLKELKFEGGNINELLSVLLNRRFNDNNYSYYSHYLEYLNSKHTLLSYQQDGEIFNHGAYYTYLKEQKFRGTWYGKGTLAFYFDGSWVLLEIHNNKVINAEGNLFGKVDKRFSSFIIDTLFANNLDPSFSDSLNKGYESKDKLYLGYDLSGDLSADNHLNMRGGLSYLIKGYDHNFIQEIKSSPIKHVKGNLFIVQSPNRVYKIYTLKVQRAEIIPILKKAINGGSLDEYLINHGYDSYADFINQGVLSSYGAEYYITLQELSEGYSGSALYKLFTETQKIDQSFLPTKMESAKLPAPKGSLLRMILNYQETENLDIINQPKELNPSIMSVRNEFPESFSVILAEKMNENFDKIYDDSDQLQMMNEFIKAASNDDTDKVRSSCIKLMCYWGYSGLVNVLQTYTFNKNEKNYQIFSIDNTKGPNKGVFMDLFIKLFKSLRTSVLKTFDFSKNYEWVLENHKVKDISSLFDQYIVDTVYSSYNFNLYNHHPSLSLIRMNNLIMALFKDSYFLKVLNSELSDHYPLNTLDLSPKNVVAFIATLNTLRGTWMKVKGENQIVTFDFLKSYQHLPHNIIQPQSLINEFKPVSLKTGRYKYHHFINDSLRHELSREEIYTQVGKQRCIVQQEVISELAPEEMYSPTNEVFCFEGVLNPEYMESDDYSDIMYELDSVEPDLELIESTYNDENDECFEGPKYTPSTVRRKGTSIVIPVKWYLAPYHETQLNLAKKLNNTAENLIVLSNNFINKFWELREFRVYIVNYSTYDGEMPDMIAHVLTTKKVPGDFWDKYIGGRRVKSPLELIRLTYSNSIRWLDEVKESSDLGERIGATDKTTGTKQELEVINDKSSLSPWLKAGLTEQEAQECYNFKKEKTEINEDIQRTIGEYLNNGLIDEKIAAKMAAKYNKALSSRLKIGGGFILSSFLTETELLTIHKNVLEGRIGEEVTATEHIKIMQAPESFGSAFMHSKPDNKAFKDIRYKAELDAIQEGLSSLIASSNLTISTKMFEYVQSHYNIWRKSVTVTKYKVDNKKFFLNLFLSVVNTGSKHRTSKHDFMWQNIINRMATIIGEEPLEPDISLNYYLPPSSGLRLKYKTIGFN